MLTRQIIEPYAAAAGLFLQLAAADKNASARCCRRRFRGLRAAVKVSDPISFSGENLHAAYNFWYLSASLLQFRLPGLAVVQEFLEQRHTSGVQFLSEMIAK